MSAGPRWPNKLPVARLQPQGCRKNGENGWSGAALPVIIRGVSSRPCHSAASRAARTAGEAESQAVVHVAAGGDTGEVWVVIETCVAASNEAMELGAC